MLLVDDNPTVQTAIAAQLSQIGLRTEGCVSGRAALLAATRDGAPDYLAVLLDLSMPDEDGLQILQQIREQKAGDNLPPIILMASSANDRRLESGSDLFDSFMVKPTTASSLFVEISHLLGLRAEGDKPAVAADAAGSSARGRSHAQPLKGVEALLVDDVALNQEVVRDMLGLADRGVLRAGIHKHLKGHPAVKEFRLGRYGEGESGVTVVELK